MTARRGRALDLVLAALAAAALAVAFALAPGRDVLRWPGGEAMGALCPSRLYFGVDCPFCGLTRSFVALAHGQLAEAWALHPAGPLLFAALALFVIAALATALARRAPLVQRAGFVRACDVVVLSSLALGVVHLILDRALG